MYGMLYRSPGRLKTRLSNTEKLKRRASLPKARLHASPTRSASSVLKKGDG